MDKFTSLTSIMAPMPMNNIDTDMIIPKQFLRTIKRTGLGINLFDEMRYEEDGSEKADFILNTAPYNSANILIAGENFGCGSSREHAPWALLDFGFKSIIAPSFADIFYNNSFKNGILPITLPKNDIATLLQDAETQQEITIDLTEQTICRSNGEKIDFEIDEFRRHCLLKGLDDIGLTLNQSDDIKIFEENREKTMPWLS